MGIQKKLFKHSLQQHENKLVINCFRVQNNLEPNDWKPMPSIGKGVKEIRIHNPFEHRVIYVAKFQERVYALHGFSKKTQKTSKKDINLSGHAREEKK